MGCIKFIIKLVILTLVIIGAITVHNAWKDFVGPAENAKLERTPY